MKKILRKISLIASLIVLSSSILNSNETTQNAPYPFSGADMKWVDSVFNSLSLDEKIGQLFMVSAYSDPKQNNSAKIKSLITDYKIGGVIFFKGTPTVQAMLTNEFQSLSKIPLAIAIDGEWGLAMRLDSTTAFPRQMQLGAISNDKLIYNMGEEIGRQCARMGIHINFAPDVDINNNANNPVINFRSFGESKHIVAEKSLQYMSGMQSQRILTTAKHFPGHGDVDSDSHLTMPLLKVSKQRLDTLELYPFKYLISNKLTGVMVAHLSVPALDKTKNLPTTLSPKVITNLLRKDLNFNGLIFTDALNMKGVAAYFPAGEIEVRALQAGNDVLLCADDVPTALKAIKKAIVDNRLSEEIINDRCYRILTAKSWMRVQERTHVELANLYKDLHSKESLLLKKRLIQASITVVKDSKNQLPFRNLNKMNMAIVSFQNGKSTFAKGMEKYTATKRFVLPTTADATKLQKLLQDLQAFNTVVIDVQGTSAYATKNYGITQAMIDAISQISARNNVVLVLHSNPYVLNRLTAAIPQIETIVVAYDFSSEVQRETPQVLFGALPAQGKLSVSAGGFPVGTLVQFNAIGRLQYGDAFDVGMSDEKLQTIDSIVNTFISYHAMPGCQVLVAKNGVVVYEKPFGRFSYESTDSVTENTLYDLASITKSAGATVSLMKLYDANLFSLDKTMGSYLPRLQGSWIDTLLVSDVMTHQAGLAPGISLPQTLIRNYREKGIKSGNRSEEFPTKIDERLYIKSTYELYQNAISAKPDAEHSIHVANNVYLNNDYADTIFRLIADSKPLKRTKRVVYSDLGFYLLTDVVKTLSGTTLDKFATNQFYAKLGANTLGYNPTERFSSSEIAPTETEEFFRKQLLQGYVHDLGAAMMGGVSGHAGLFSNANDLAKLLQMLLNKGYYGGEQFLRPETVELFTSCGFCDLGNRKGFGFDKPEPDGVHIDPTCHCTSLKSFGHTGFTGTIFWVDPENSLIYIFLSNRVNRFATDASNTMLGDSAVRPRIQKAIYNAIM